MKKFINILGIGPKLLLLTIMYLLLINSLINNKYDCSIYFIPFNVLLISGIVFIIGGIAFLIPSLIAIINVYKSESLYTKGVYSFCRHPLYSSWIVFIIPGIMLLTNSWVLLTVPLFMYFLFRLLIEEEEFFLLKKYGEDYKSYKNNVGLLFPKKKA